MHSKSCGCSDRFWRGPNVWIKTCIWIVIATLTCVFYKMMNRGTQWTTSSITSLLLDNSICLIWTKKTWFYLTYKKTTAINAMGCMYFTWLFISSHWPQWNYKLLLIRKLLSGTVPLDMPLCHCWAVSLQCCTFQLGLCMVVSKQTPIVLQRSLVVIRYLASTSLGLTAY